MKNVIYLILIAAALIITGCGAMLPTQTRLEMAAQFGELERHMEAKVGSPEMATNNMDLQDMCIAYANLKRYNKALACLDEMQKRIDRGDTQIIFLGQNAGYITLEHAHLRSQILIEMGEYSAAIDEAQKLLELNNEYGTNKRTGKKREYGRTAGYYLEALHLMGLAYALSGKREDAEKCVDKLEEMKMSYPYTLLKDSKYLAIAKINIALGRYDRARTAFEVMKQKSDFIRTASTVVAAAVLQVGDMWSFQDLPKNYTYFKVLLETGDAARAKQGYDELLKVPQIKDNGPIYWMVLFDRGRIAEQEGDLKQAIGFYGRAVDIIEQQRSTINTEASKIGFVGDKQAVYRRLIDALFSDRQYAAALEYIERSKSRALMDMLAMKKDFAVHTGNEKQVRELLALKDKSEQEALVQNETTSADNTRSVVIRTKDQLQQKAPELASLVSVTSLSVAEIQKLIPADEALVEYYYTDKYLSVFVLTSHGLAAVRLDSSRLPEEIRNFRTSLESTSSNAYEAQARQLFNRLIKPVEDSLSCTRLIIVPHGALHYLPFYALHDGRDYLIERYSIRMLPSASVITYLRREKIRKPGGVLAFGNPDVGDPKYDLAYAQNEAVAVSKTQPRSKVLLRKDATETALNRYGDGFSYIHFATHGEFDADKPLNSALLLAQDNEHDGRLTVDKLYSMKLDADLVTLSACETGLSRIANGDDLVGLTRGFLYAGCSSIVASLWKVDDLATSQLMTRFYEGIDKTDKREALRTAQLETKKKYTHPYYWASFQLTGNTN